MEDGVLKMTKKESTTFHPFYTRGAGSIFERKQAFRVGELMARCKVAVQAEERGKKKKKTKRDSGKLAPRRAH